MDKQLEHLGRRKNMEKLLSIKYMEYLTLMTPMMHGQFLDFHLPLRKDIMEASICMENCYLFYIFLTGLLGCFLRENCLIRRKT